MALLLNCRLSYSTDGDELYRMWILAMPLREGGMLKYKSANGLAWTTRVVAIAKVWKGDSGFIAEALKTPEDGRFSESAGEIRLGCDEAVLFAVEGRPDGRLNTSKYYLALDCSLQGERTGGLEEWPVQLIPKREPQPCLSWLPAAASLWYRAEPIGLERKVRIWDGGDSKLLVYIEEWPRYYHRLHVRVWVWNPARESREVHDRVWTQEHYALSKPIQIEDGRVKRWLAQYGRVKVRVELDWMDGKKDEFEEIVGSERTVR